MSETDGNHHASRIAQDFTPTVPLDDCFDAHYGLELVDEDVVEGVVRARVQVTDRTRNALGVVHGGIYTSIAESIASRGTALAVMPHGRLAMGLSNDTTVVAQLRDGVIHAEARAHARGDDAWVWTVEARDDAGRVCALSRLTIAVR